MKRTGFLLLLICVFSTVGFSANVIKVNRSFDIPSFLGYVQNEIIVVLKDTETATVPSKTLSSWNAFSEITDLEEIGNRFDVDYVIQEFRGARATKASSAIQKRLASYFKVRFSGGSLEEVMAAYRGSDRVAEVQPIGIHSLYAEANDPYYRDSPNPSFPYDQWHYYDTHSIHANQAWDVNAGDASVKIGILDSGTRYFHVDIGGDSPQWGPDAPFAGGNVFINPNETPGDGIDNDGNGYIDDVIGWDFVESAGGFGVSCIDQDCGTADNDPDDGDGHGTHVSGTVAAITNNGALVAGVAGGFSAGTVSDPGNGVEIIPCRIGYHAKYHGLTTGVVRMDYAAEAMYYLAGLIDAGQDVTAINCSWGSSNSGGLGAAVDNLIAHDVVVVVAAGNSNSSSPDYLGSRGDCLDVAATDQNGNGASFSNYGSWVDVAAPGVQILSTYRNPDDPDPTAQYIAVLDGTSMSAPHVAGIVGLLESCNPSLSATQKFNYIVNNTNPYSDSRDLGSGIADAFKAMNAAGCGGTPCDLAADFSGSPTSGCAPLMVSFTDLSSGTGIDGWSWDFGDGVGTSSAQNPSYTYNSAGTYTVSLTVSSSSQGCNDTQTKTGYITVQEVPVANFSGSPTSGSAPLTVDFSDLSSGNPTSWSWDFGDGVGSSSAQNPSYTYDAAGTYTVTLTASNTCGSDVDQKVDYITVTEPTQNFMHVSALTVSRQQHGPWLNGVATVTIVDQNGTPVANATVFGFFNFPNTNTLSAVTGSDGVAVIDGDRSRSSSSDICFEVTDVTHATNIYDSGANVVTSACESGPLFSEGDPRMSALPTDSDLGQNTPNPFNPSTEISFSLDQPGMVRIEVYNIVGQRVATLFDGYRDAGEYSVTWNSVNDQGQQVSSGLYFYKMTTSKKTLTRKMLLLK
jgi:serine protease